MQRASAGCASAPRKASSRRHGECEVGTALLSWGEGLCLYRFSSTGHRLPLGIGRPARKAVTLGKQLFSTKPFPEDAWQPGAFCSP